MAENKPAAKTAPTLPKIDEIASVAPSELPAATRATLDDDARKLAEAIIAATANGNAAVGPSMGADRKVATAAAARIKRLVNAYHAAQGTPEATRPTVTTRIVAKDGGFAWAVSIATPNADVAATEGDTPEGDTPSSETSS